MVGSLISGTRRILDAPLGRSNWHKKMAIWSLLGIIGYPLYFLVLCLALSPLFSGGALLSIQVYLYLQDGRWYSFSALDVATYTMDESLANEIGQPRLSSCKELRNVLVPDHAAQHHPDESCPNLDVSWQQWLVHPSSWFGLHRILLPTLNVASIPFLILCVGLVTWHYFSKLRDILHRAAGKPL